MNAAQQASFKIVLHYVSVDLPEQALNRIHSRVAHGGHNVPETDVRRRFQRSLSNLPRAIALADKVIFHDNSRSDYPFREFVILSKEEWWIASRVPEWTDQVLAQVQMPSNE